MISMAPMCIRCEHLDEDSKDPIACKAFPSGIPDEIFVMGIDHTLPYPGDHGIRFGEKIESK